MACHATHTQYGDLVSLKRKAEADPEKGQQVLETWQEHSAHHFAADVQIQQNGRSNLPVAVLSSTTSASCAAVSTYLQAIAFAADLSSP